MAPQRLGFAVLTVSSSRTLEQDATGGAIAEAAQQAGHTVVDRLLVPDELTAIRGAARVLLERAEVDVVVVDGGTGFSPQDVTPEALQPLLELELPGFGELFRALSFEQVGAAAMLSRALAGIARGKALFLVPGAPAAAQLAMERLILPEAGHLLGQARRRR